MNELTNFWEEFVTSLTSQFESFNIADAVDILIVAFIAYKVIDFIRESRAAQLIKGILFILIVVYFSGVLGLATTNFLLANTLQVGVLAVVVLFQPELRRALEQVGRSRIGLDLFSDNPQDEEAVTKMIEEVASACHALSASKTGALIVFERSTQIEDIIETGTKLDAAVSKELVEAIFYDGNPLHDGAVVIRNTRVAAAMCLLPLTGNRNLSKELGTRHRAAIGMSEASDALVVVVSEETGKMSVVKDGHIRREYKYDTLKDTLTETFIMKDEEKTSILGRLFKKGGAAK